ncbi:DUF1517 domain-containing protein [Oscillatoria salina]|uniref:DUF1517 domain-containing protein n=1 Tax=Oscillatoria salina TaxID=331517 RepID=UPI0013BE7A0A|nr:DUF1517 domain-containing protein [Oscillatoria salina]MBZ8179629.1 DUF1517 domain-containing protein [Oscillatoria salina IIICB1]NET90865.1 DUF1517 domain-containing protein [Kamptonema sp. SIO1D9]
MLKKLLPKFKPLLKSLLVVGLIFTLVFSHAPDALAARSGGRIGGGSFRAPSRTYSPPGGGYRAPGGGYGYPGGGFGFPFLFPFFGIGGGFGGLFTILIFLAIANFIVRSFRNSGISGGDGAISYSNPKVSVAKVQVGLLSDARNLQKELNDLGRTANTDTAAGRALVLQEASLALLRHPEYWVYGATESDLANLDSAEAKFNQLALGERSKFTEETLSNVEGQLRQASKPALNQGNGELATQIPQEPGEYIVVTVVVGVEGKLDLPQINSADDLRQALREIGGVGSDRLLAVEVLWTPQAEGDTLTTDDILAGYPDLKLV